MTDIVKGMARAACDAGSEPVFDKQPSDLQYMQMEDMCAALLWLADNVSDEMVRAASADRAKDDEGQFQPLCDLIDFSGENKTRTVLKSAIAAAIRAAAGGWGMRVPGSSIMEAAQ